MNLVFDLGGVVVWWQPDVLIARVFPDPATQAIVRERLYEHPDWVALDRGTLPRGEAAARAAGRTGLPVAEIGRFLAAVPPALVPMPESVDLMYRLKAHGHRLYCLSNMHVAAIEHLERTCGFWEVFTGKVISCRIHLCKPEPAIYAHLLEAHRLTPAETVFIDDMQVNVDAAVRLGIHPLRFESVAQCEAALRALGCL
jgi:putative hydrolase of the HAD superfamily